MPVPVALAESPWRPIWPMRRDAPLAFDPVAVVDSVLRRARACLDDRDRGEWQRERLLLYAKYRGWLAEKTYPWVGCSNAHLPLLQIGELRTQAGLHNIVMALRPLLTAKATQRAQLPKEERITQLIDSQLFLDPGPDRAEQVFTDFIMGFTQDSNVVAYTPWVRDERTITTTHYRPPVPDGLDPEVYLEGHLRQLFPRIAGLEPHPGRAGQYTALVPDEYDRPIREVEVTVELDPDGAVVLTLRRDEVLFDGPVIVNLDIDKILVPTRADNLQPPSADNPNGAPWVFLDVDYRIDDLRRLRAQGELNRLTDDGLDAIIAQARAAVAPVGPTEPTQAQALQQQKDEMEGRVHRPLEPRDDSEVGMLPIPCWLCFDQWDLGGGHLEDVVWLIARDAEVLCDARRLGDRWPATKPYRPLAEACAIPVKGRWYGISLLKLGESLYDLIKGTLDLLYDSAALSNRPFFFYGASSKMPTELISLSVGEGYPVPGNPRDTVYFPTLPTQNQRWGFDIIGLAMQFYERVMMQGDIQLGRVPTGKASALRTVGTTMALLQQGDVRADQLLLRLFSGLRQIALNFHRLNRHLLPRNKEIRRLGWDGAAEQAYVRLGGVEDIDADVDFDFRPDFLLTNRALLTQTLQSALQVIGTPLAFQLGMTGPAQFYEAVKDYLRALQLDWKKYVSPPAGGGPPILAQEAIGLIRYHGQLPEGTPLEGAALHRQRLVEYATSDQFGELSPEQVQLFKAWFGRITEQVSREQLAHAAQTFQTAMAQQAGTRPQGVETTIQEPALTPAQQGLLPPNA